MIIKHVGKRATTYGVRLSRAGGKREWVGTFPSLQEARKAEARALVAPKRRVEAVLDVFLDEWLEGYRQANKRSSFDTMKASIGKLKEDFRGRKLSSITVEEAERWARDNRWRTNAVISFFNAAKKKQLVDTNPFAGLSVQTRGRKDLDPLTVEQVDHLASIPGQLEEFDAQYAPVFKGLILFAAYSGMRESELFGLEWRDIDLNKGRVQVRRQNYKGQLTSPKSGKPRLIALLPQARDALLTVPRTQDWVFPAKRGGRLSSGMFNQTYWPPVKVRYGAKVDFHELRHFAGHFLYVTQDLPSRVVATQLGHSTPRLVESTYGHWKVGALDEIDRAFGQTPDLKLVRAATGGDRSA